MQVHRGRTFVSHTASMSDWQLQLRAWLWSRQAPLDVVNWLDATQTSLEEDAQDAILQLIQADAILSAAPLERDYRSKLLKRLVTCVEGRGEALCDALVEQYSEVVAAAACSDDTMQVG